MSKRIVQIQKVQNVTKLILFLFTLLYTSLSFSQKNIIGTYSVDFKLKDFSTIYSFYENGTFEKTTEGDVGRENYGKGHYYIKNDSLILNYDLTELEENSYHKIKYYENYNNQVKVEINLFDLNKNPIEEVEVINDVNNSRDKPNKDGTIIYFFPKKSGWVKFRVLNYWFGTHEFTITTNLNSQVEVYLRRSSGAGIKDVIFKYRILELNSEKLKLETKSGIMTLKRIENKNNHKP